jgi:hypothetical protein
MLEELTNGGFERMRANRPVRRVTGFVVLVGVTSLSACAQPKLPELASQLAAYAKYTAQMEDTYAAQEAEILALRQELAALRSGSQGE